MELNTNQITLSWLNSTNGISNGKIEKLLEYFGGVDKIWDNFENEKNNLNLLKPEIIYNLSKTKKTFKENLTNKLAKENASIVTYFDDEYPKKLKNISGSPYILYYKGNLKASNSISIAIVGSRKATEYGIWVTEKFAKELSELGVTIISGLANGIDTVAHKTAIKYNANTIGVIGCGIDIVYPKKNETLFNKILDCDGAVISEYPFGMQPMPSNFPDRNRIISGLSDGVLVIEAQEKSGTLITAGHAANQGREIFAVPGNIDSFFSIGTNLLIKDGAKIVTCIEDIIEEIPELRKIIHKKLDDNTIINLNENESKIINSIISNNYTLFDIANNTSMEIGEILGTLTILELKGLIRKTSGERYIFNK